MKVLILTGKFGMGHYSVAQTLEQQIMKDYAHYDIEIIDVLEYIIPKTSKVVYHSFNMVVTKASGLYNFLYKSAGLFEEPTVVYKTFLKKVSVLLEEKRADVVISTLPLSSALVSIYKEETGADIPLITCITDVTCHHEWIHPKTNMYLVASTEVKSNLEQLGIRADNIIVGGIPVKEQFKITKEKPVRAEKHLLIMGGGLGLIPLEEDFYERLSCVPNVRVTVIMGHNKKGYAQLHGKYRNIHVIGYTNKVHEFMEQADVIISKAGGITLFEIIHKELPVLVLHPFLEQEKFNAHFIEKRGIGRVLWNKKQHTADAALHLLMSDHERQKMSQNMRTIKAEIETNIIHSILKCKETIEVA
ncbi:MAG: MGDG synthase family glycosyltransferase [Bacilli bacterium]